LASLDVFQENDVTELVVEAVLELNMNGGTEYIDIRELPLSDT